MNSSRNLTETEYSEFCVFLKQACGINLGENKHYLVNSRLNRILNENNISTIAELLRRIDQQTNPYLKDRIIDAMTTNETFWFRDIYPFDALRNTVFPDLLDRNRTSIRVWSAACSTGQEPYSIGIVAEEFFASRLLQPQVNILATDISPTSLERARTGLYDEKQLLRGMSEERRLRFFDNHGEAWKIVPAVQKRVQFRLLNLLQPYAGLGSFEVIFCRNVLIYFSQEMKFNILSRMLQCLVPGGYLFLGSSETISGLSNMPEMIKTPNGVYYRRTN